MKDKNNFKQKISKGLILKDRNYNLLMSFLILLNLFTGSVSAQQIIPDGNTHTILNISGKTTSITTQTIQGKNAFNSFDKFNIVKGQIVNLVTPESANNLINLIHNEHSNINGTLNALKSNVPGGNIILMNPYGLTVGSEGSINVGSLHVITPVKSFMDSFFTAPGVPDISSVNSILNNTVPINPQAVVNIQGNINAIESVTIDTGAINHSGLIKLDNSELFNSVVSSDSTEQADAITKTNGKIALTAINDISISGVIKAQGSDNVSGSNINIVAGDSVKLNVGTLIDSSGTGTNSNAGNVYIYGENETSFNDGATIKALGGNISGDGALIEISAGKTVSLNGGSARATAVNGFNGRLFIDPDEVIVSEDYITYGDDINISADFSITIKEGVTLCSRGLGDGDDNMDYLTESSVSDSGHITFEAPEINLEAGSSLLSFADNGFSSGDINLNVVLEGSNVVGTVNVNSTDSDPVLLKGGNVNISVNTSDTYEFSADDILTPRGSAISTINIGDGTQIEVDSNISLNAYAEADSKLFVLTLPLLNTFNDFPANAAPEAIINIGENVSINAGQIVDITAESDASSFVDTIFFTPPSDATPISEINIAADTEIISINNNVTISSLATAESYAVKNAANKGGAVGTVFMGLSFSKSNAIAMASTILDDDIDVNAENGKITISSESNTDATAISIAGSLSTEKSTLGGTVPISNAIPFAQTTIGDSNNISGKNIAITSKNNATAFSEAIYATLAASEDKTSVGSAISVANTSIDTTPGDYINVAAGGLLAAPFAIINLVKDDTVYPDYNAYTYIGKNASVDATRNIEIYTSQIFTSDADATAGAGSGKNGLAGAAAYADSNPIGITEIDESANVFSLNRALTIYTNSYSESDAMANAGAIAMDGTGVGASVAVSKSRPEAYTFINTLSDLSTDNYDYGDINISSIVNSNSCSQALAGAGAGEYALGAAVSYSETLPTATTLLFDNVTIDSAKDITISSYHNAYSESLSSFAAVAKDAGAGAAISLAFNKIDDIFGYNSLALVNTGSELYADNNITIKANDQDEDEITYNASAKSYSVAAAGGSKAGIAGSSSTSVSDSASMASLDNGVLAETTSGDINIQSKNNSIARATADAGAVAKNAGVGAAVVVTQSNPIAISSIGENSIIRSGNDLNLLSNASAESLYYDEITKFNSIAGAGAKDFAGGASVIYSDAIPITESFIGDNSIVTVDNDINIIANDYGYAYSKAGFVAVAKEAAIGAVVTVSNTSLSDDSAFEFNSNAYIGSYVNVIAGNDVNILTNEDDEDNSIAFSHAIAGAGGGTLGLAGSAATSLANSKTNVSINEGSSVTTTSGNIKLIANNNTSALASADSVGVSKTTGVGTAASISMSNAEAYASIAKNSTINAGNNLSIKANVNTESSYADYLTCMSSMAGAGALTFSGSASVAYSDAIPVAKAFIGYGSDVTVGNNVYVTAFDKSEATARAGVAAIAKDAGTGGTVTIANTSLPDDSNDYNSEAYIGSYVNLTAGNDIYIRTNPSVNITSEVLSHAIAGAGGNKAGIAAASATSIANTKSQAYIKDNSNITASNGSLLVRAYNKSKTKTTSNAIAVGGEGAAIGAVATYSYSNPEAISKIYHDTSITANGINVTAVSNGISTFIDDYFESDDFGFNALAGAGLASVSTGLAVVINDSSPTAKAIIGNNAYLYSVGSDITINSDYYSDAYAKAAFGVVNSGVAIGAIVTTSNSKPTALTEIKENVTLIAGNDINISANPEEETDAKAEAYSFTGTAGGTSLGAASAVSTSNPENKVEISPKASITAQNDINITSYSDSLAKATTNAIAISSGNAAFSAAVPVAMAEPLSEISVTGASVISNGGKINIVSTGNVETETDIISVGAGGFAVSASASYEKAAPVVNTYIKDGSVVRTNSNDNIALSALSNIAANALNYGIASGNTGTGSLSVPLLEVVPELSCYISDSTVRSKNDLTMKTEAIINIEGDTTAAAIGSGTVNLGGSGLYSNTTPVLNSYISNNADVSANYALNIFSNTQINNELQAIGAGAGSGIGTGAAVIYAESNSELYSYVSDSTVSANNINVTSINNSSLTANSYAGAAGGFLAIGAAVTDLDVNNFTSAFIDSDSNITANNSLYLKSKTNDYIEGNAVGVSLSTGQVGAGASVALINYDPVSHTYIDNSNATANGSIIEITGEITSDMNTNTLAGTVAQLSGAGAVTEITSNPQLNVYIDGSNNIYSAGDVELAGTINLSPTVKATGASLGIATAGAAVPLIDVESMLNVYITDSTIDAGNDLFVTGEVIETHTADAFAGSAGGLALGAAVIDVYSNPEIDVHINNDSIITVGNDLYISANNETNANYYAKGAAAGLAGAGAACAYAELIPTIDAFIGNSNLDVTGDLFLTTNNTLNANAKAKAGAAGVLSGAGADSTALANGEVNSYILNNSDVSADNIEVKANSDVVAYAESIGGSGALIGTGAALTETEASPQTQAYLKESTVDASSLLVDASATTEAESNSTAGSAGGITAGAAVANSKANPNTNASIVYESDIETRSNTKVNSFTKALATSNADASNASLLGTGAAVTEAKANPTNESYIKNSDVLSRAGHIQIFSEIYTTAETDSYAGGAGAITAGAALATSETEPVTKSYIDNDADLTTRNGNVTVKSTAKYIKAKAESEGAAAGAIGAGYAESTAKALPVIKSYINNSSVDVDNDINVLAEYLTSVADMPIRSVSIADAGAAGVVSGSGSEALSRTTADFSAYIDSDLTIKSGDDINITSSGTAFSNAETTSAVYALGGGGKIKSTSKALPSVYTYLAGNSIDAGNNINISSDGISSASSTGDAEMGAGMSGQDLITYSEGSTLAQTTIEEDSIIKVGNDMNLSATIDDYASSTNDFEGKSGIDSGGDSKATAENNPDEDKGAIIFIKPNTTLTIGNDLNMTAIINDSDDAAYTKTNSTGGSSLWFHGNTSKSISNAIANIYFGDPEISYTSNSNININVDGEINLSTYIERELYSKANIDIDGLSLSDNAVSISTLNNDASIIINDDSHLKSGGPLTINTFSYGDSYGHSFLKIDGVAITGDAIVTPSVISVDAVYLGQDSSLKTTSAGSKIDVTSDGYIVTDGYAYKDGLVNSDGTITPVESRIDAIHISSGAKVASMGDMALDASDINIKGLLTVDYLKNVDIVINSNNKITSGSEYVTVDNANDAYYIDPIDLRILSADSNKTYPGKIWLTSPYIHGDGEINLNNGYGTVNIENYSDYDLYINNIRYRVDYANDANKLLVNGSPTNANTYNNIDINHSVIANKNRTVYVYNQPGSNLYVTNSITNNSSFDNDNRTAISLNTSSLNGGDFHTTAGFEINHPDMANYNVIFKPESIECQDFKSNYLATTPSMYIDTTKMIRLSNFDKITVNNDPIVLDDIWLNAGLMIELNGAFTAYDMISVDSGTSIFQNNTSYTANYVFLKSNNTMSVDAIYNAANLLNIESSKGSLLLNSDSTFNTAELHLLSKNSIILKNEIETTGSLSLTSTAGAITTDGYSEDVYLSSPEINLNADVFIGLSSAPILIKSNNTQLSAFSDGSINLKELTGDLIIDQIQSNSNYVSLENLAGKLNGKSNNTYNIGGTSININAADFSGYITLDTSGRTTINSLGRVFIEGTAGNLTVNADKALKMKNIVTNNANLETPTFLSIKDSTLNGDLTSVSNKSEIDNSIIRSHADIEVADNALIKDSTFRGRLKVTTNDNNGSFINIDNTTVNGALVLETGGNIISNGNFWGVINVEANNLDLSSNKVSIGSVNVANNASILARKFDIIDNQYVPVSINAGQLSLQATRGSIGTATNYLGVSVTGDLTAQANNGIYINQYNQDLHSSNINTNNASACVNVYNGSAYIDYISAPSNVKVTVTGPDLEIGTIDPAVIDLSSTADNGTINVDQAYVSQNVLLHSDNITFVVYDTDSTSPIAFTASGQGNSTSKYILIKGASPQGLLFNELNADNATIINLLEGTNVIISNGNVSGVLNIESDLITLLSGDMFNQMNFKGLSQDPVIEIFGRNVTNPALIADYDTAQVLKDIHYNQNETYQWLLKSKDNQVTNVLLSDPQMYLDPQYKEITLQLLQQAFTLYSHNKSNSQYMDNSELNNLLNSANMTPDIAKNLLKVEFVSSNSDYVSLLNVYIDNN